MTDFDRFSFTNHPIGQNCKRSSVKKKQKTNLQPDRLLTLVIQFRDLQQNSKTRGCLTKKVRQPNICVQKNTEWYGNHSVNGVYCAYAFSSFYSCGKKILHLPKKQLSVALLRTPTVSIMIIAIVIETILVISDPPFNHNKYHKQHRKSR